MNESACRAELHRKYAAMLALRRAYPESQAAPPGAELRRLAGEYPGSLRELDLLPREMIEARLEALDAKGALPDWALPMLRYHAWMRVALLVKKEIGRANSAEMAQKWVKNEYVARDGEPNIAEVVAELTHILAPAGGRLNQWLFHRLAQEFGVEANTLEELLFMSPKNFSVGG